MLMALGSAPAFGRWGDRLAQPFLAMEVLTIAGAHSRWKSNVSENAQRIVNANYNSAQGTVSSSLGSGLRGGILFPLDYGLEIGPSIGYIKGPTGEFEIDFQSVTKGPGGAVGSINIDFWRFLLEFGQNWLPSERYSLRFGVGVGYATGGMDVEEMYSGSIATLMGRDRTDIEERWGGLTWEMSPAVQFHTGKKSVELGFRMVGLPQKQRSSRLSEFEWKPFSFYLGVLF